MLNAATFNFDPMALAAPKTTLDCIALAKEILAELSFIDSCFDEAIAKCEALTTA